MKHETYLDNPEGSSEICKYHEQQIDNISSHGPSELK
jgi:hypothetical protein